MRKTIKIKGVSIAVICAYGLFDTGINGVLAAPPETVTADAPQESIQTVVVTAQRREQRLVDVPASITAIKGLEERGITDFQSYLQSIPSASFADQGSSGSEVKLRGVGNGTSQLSPTTAVYLGEVPVIHTGRATNSSYNFKLVDIDRIEVLRGPQGQLYGSNSLGGAIKNIPNQPTFNGFSGSASAGGSNTEHGSGNYDVDATVNIPFSPEFAVRVTAYDSKQSGWYKNIFAGGPQLGKLFPPNAGPIGLMPALLNNPVIGPGIKAYAAPANNNESNDQTVNGGRIIFALKPSRDFDVQLMIAQERKKQDGPGWAMAIPNTTPGPIPGTYLVPGGLKIGATQVAYTQPSDASQYQYSNSGKIGTSDEIKLANLVLNYNMDFAKFTSSTSYWDRTEVLATNIGFHSFFVTGIWDSFPVVVDRKDNPKNWVQEFRLTSPSKGPLTWLAGLYYSKLDQNFSYLAHEDTGLDIRYQAAVAMGRRPGGVLPTTKVVTSQNATFVDKQTAVFGEIAYDVMPTVNLAFSFRDLSLEQSMVADNAGYLFVGSGHDLDTRKEDKFLPKVNVSWKPEKGQMLYFTAAEGYRTGVINRAVPTTGSASCSSNLAALGFAGLDRAPATKSDTLWNYEIGAKTALADGINLNAAIYHIKWKDLQNHIILTSFGSNPNCNSDQMVNAGDATIDGAELELNARITKRLRLDASLSYTRPEYKNDMPALRIKSGQTIDGTPRSQASAALQYAFDLIGNPAWLRGEWIYVGRMENKSDDFFTQTPPYTTGDYSQFNLRAGVDLTDKLSLSAYVTNLSDKFGVTRQTDVGSQGAPTLWTIRPRTIGATLRATF